MRISIPAPLKYLDENNVHLLPDEEINDNNRLFLEGCRKLGYHVEQFPINVKGCKGSGLCNLGCPNQAKQGTHRVQLPQAEARGVEVITNCRVTTIGDHFVEARVADPGYGEPSPWEPGDYRIKAKDRGSGCRRRGELSGVAAALGLRRPLPHPRALSHPASGADSGRGARPARSATSRATPRVTTVTSSGRVTHFSSKSACTSRSSPPKTSSVSAPNTRNSCRRFPVCR